MTKLWEQARYQPSKAESTLTTAKELLPLAKRILSSIECYPGGFVVILNCVCSRDPVKVTLCDTESTCSNCESVDECHHIRLVKMVIFRRTNDDPETERIVSQLLVALSRYHVQSQRIHGVLRNVIAQQKSVLHVTANPSRLLIVEKNGVKFSMRHNRVIASICKRCPDQHVGSRQVPCDCLIALLCRMYMCENHPRK
jgi:hypothetical protein